MQKEKIRSSNRIFSFLYNYIRNGIFKYLLFGGRVRIMLLFNMKSPSSCRGPVPFLLVLPGLSAVPPEGLEKLYDDERNKCKSDDCQPLVFSHFSKFECFVEGRQQKYRQREYK